MWVWVLRGIEEEEGARVVAGLEREGKEREGQERKGKKRKGKERTGKDRTGKKSKGKAIYGQGRQRQRQRQRTYHADEPAGDGELELVVLGEEGGDLGEDGHALHVPLRVLA